jgi:vacuolar-type H+-ATPase subunit E/Vma4
VETKEFKDALIEAYHSIEQAVLAALRKRVRQSHERLIEQYQSAEVQVNKGATTADEVLALKKLIQAQQTAQEQMKEEIKQNKAAIDLLVEHTMPIPTEVRCVRTGACGPMDCKI